MRPSFLCVVALLPALAGAQTADAPADPVALPRAVANSPTMAAAAQRIGAAQARVQASGKLPDVQVEGMGSRKVGAMDARSTMWEFNVRQPLPKRGERAADRERAKAGVSMAEADYALMAGDMTAEVSMSLVEAEAAEQRANLLEAQVRRLEALLRSVESRVASGSSRLSDRLAVQTQIASMQIMIADERLMAGVAQSQARGLLGLAPDAPLPAVTLPAASEIVPDEAPAIRLAAARVDEARAMIRMARASGNPMTSVGARFENERGTMGEENTVGFAVMTDLPFRSRRYARADTQAAEAERAAAEANAQAARHRIASTLSRVAQTERLAATASQLSNDTLSRLNAEYDSLLRTASAGGMGESTILMVVELLEKMTNAELGIIKAHTGARLARTDLWRHVPAVRHLPSNG